MPSTTYKLQVDRNGKKVSMNDIQIYRPVFDGRYYIGKPMVLSCDNPECGWRITITHNNNTTEEIECFESTYTIIAQSHDKKIYAQVIEPTGISQLSVDSGSDSFTANGPQKLYNLQGMYIKTIDNDDQIEELPAGVYIIGGKKVMVR